ncbi:hypothetical protein ScPMuIL_009485 [Solemya velum]
MSDLTCGDPFHPAFGNYVRKCRQRQDGTVGLRPARFCIKIKGTSTVDGTEMVIRSCSLENMDSVCGIFKFEAVSYNGCVLSVRKYVTISIKAKRLLDSGRNSYSVFLEALEKDGCSYVIDELEQRTTETQDGESSAQESNDKNNNSTIKKNKEVHGNTESSLDEGDGASPGVEELGLYEDAFTVQLDTIADAFTTHVISTEPEHLLENIDDEPKNTDDGTCQNTNSVSTRKHKPKKPKRDQPRFGLEQMGFRLGSRSREVCVAKQVNGIEQVPSPYHITPKENHDTYEMYNELLAGPGSRWYGRLTLDEAEEIIQTKGGIMWYDETKKRLYLSETSMGDIFHLAIITFKSNDGTWFFKTKGCDKVWPDLKQLQQYGLNHDLPWERRKTLRNKYPDAMLY